MIPLVVMVWPAHAWVLAEETPGVVRRLSGDPWDDDGALPLLLARVGREAYIGTLAEHVAYESPRAELRPVVHGLDGDDGVEATARFLRVLDDALRRRLPHEPLAWRFAVTAGVAPAALAQLSAACWMAGLAEARVDRLPALPLPPGAPSGAARVFGLFDGLDPIAALAWSAPDGASTALALSRGDDDTQDDVLGESDAPFGADVRGAPHLAAWRRRALDRADAPAVVAVPDRARWSLRSLSAHALRDAEARRWQALGRLLADPEWPPSAQGAAPAVLEWGQRHWVTRLDAVGSQLLAQSLGRPIAPIPLEALPGLLPAASPTLDRTLAFALEPGSEMAADRKIVATAGAALPFRSEHLLGLRRTGQARIAFELQALDERSAQAYRIASGVLALPAPCGPRNAIHLGVACHACGVVELSFDVPSWHFRETVVIDPDGHAHPDARRRALDLQTGC